MENLKSQIADQNETIDNLRKEKIDHHNKLT